MPGVSGTVVNRFCSDRLPVVISVWYCSAEASLILADGSWPNGERCFRDTDFIDWKTKLQLTKQLIIGIYPAATTQNMFSYLFYTK